MSTPDVFQVVLGLAAFLCTLATGLVLIFAIVVMPGLGTLGDHAFLQAFQVIDRVIQRNQPVFIAVWMGAVVAVLLSAVIGFNRLEGAAWVVLLVAALIYLFGVQVPTFAINIPLNNRLQGLNIDALDGESARLERQIFEPRWNRWNLIRTILGAITSILLIYLLAVG